MIERIKKLKNKLEIRFIIVGILNTIVGYNIYALLVFVGWNYLIANTMSTIIGVIHSYIWNRLYTFKSDNKLKDEIPRFIGVYLLSYSIGMVTLYIFKDVLNISPYIAGIINLFITTLVSFFGHKYFSFRR